MGVERFGQGLVGLSGAGFDSVFRYIVGKTACCRTHLRIE